MFVVSVLRTWRLADGMDNTLIVIALAAVALLGLMLSVRIVQQYERGVVFRLGRVQGGVRPPGLTFITPIVDRLRKVNVQVITMSIPAQDGITEDNVSVRVDAVVYFRVVDAVKAIVNVQNYPYAVSQVAQTSLRSVIGRADLDALLSQRDRLNAELTAIIDGPTELPWGVKVERVEVKDVALPEAMKRSMSRQAEAERERRARVITADGEFQASAKLAQAAATMAADPAAAATADRRPSRRGEEQHTRHAHPRRAAPLLRPRGTRTARGPYGARALRRPAHAAGDPGHPHDRRARTGQLTEPKRSGPPATVPRQNIHATDGHPTEEGRNAMTAERSSPANTDSTMADRGSTGTIEGGPEITRNAQSATSDTAARAAETGEALRESSRKAAGTAGKVTAEARQSIPAPLRHAAGRATQEHDA
jgi:regulator of protease activity HflC (stomatin/prohibitin superfamily)